MSKTRLGGGRITKGEPLSGEGGFNSLSHKHCVANGINGRNLTSSGTHKNSKRGSQRRKKNNNGSDGFGNMGATGRR